MYLSDVDIEQAISDGLIGIEPFTTDHLSACTIDLRIGETIWIPPDPPPDYEIRPKTLKARPQDSWSRYSISDTYYLPPGQFVLGETFEKVKIQADAPIVGFIEGRSGVARHGLLIHCSAPLVHPGYGGPVTLELVNLGRHPLPLKARDSICQMAFARMSTPSSRPYPGTSKPQPGFRP